MGAVRPMVRAALVALLIALGLIVVPTAASAAAGDVGYVGASYTGATSPTADKPQSKMWFNDGRWWATMFDPTSTDWHIFYLDRTAQKWVDTKVAVDTRPGTSSDALWDGQFLFIGTHGIRSGSNASSTATPMRLYRYTYDAINKTFTPSTGFPKIISQNSSESLTIDKDSSGTVWATWTKVTGTTGQVFLNSGTSNGSSWGTPFVVPTTGGLNNPNVNPNVAVDDISTVVAFGRNKIGLLWSNQKDNTVYWSLHADGAARTTWTGGVAVRGNKLADDHLNIKSIQADAQGRVFAAVKTSLDQVAGGSRDAAQINLLSYKPGTGGGTWSSTTFGRIRDCHTRPQVVLDETNSKVYVFATGPTGTGTCTTTGAGAIYMKSTSLDAPSFGPGVGTIVMRDAASEKLNNVTTMKQSATSASGIVALASNDSTKKYWHADVVPGSATPPPVADTAKPTVPANVAAKPDNPNQVTVSWTASTDNVGVASYRVTRGTTVVAGAVTTTSFADTTVAANTQYSYTVSAVDAAGNRSAESAPVTVTTPQGSTPPPSGNGVTVASTSTNVSTTAVSQVTLDKPAGLANGDVLIAQITADNGPTLTAPAGWSTVVAPVALSSAKLFVYYKVISNAGNEPATYTWTLSAAQKWNGGITDFRGANNATPFDVTPVTFKDTTGTATSLTGPGVTTATNGALAVGGVGLNSGSSTVDPPAGWREELESTTSQITEMVSQSRATAGATGPGTWTFNKAVVSGGWMGALKPA